MSSSGGGSRVSIPEHLRKTIQDIKDITGKQHADEDVFAMLKECGMDPNETVQKLFYLDTFHEVKSKKDRRREILNNKVPESKFAPDGPGRGPRGNRNFPLGIRSGVKTQLAQREKRGNNFTDRASGGPTSASHQKPKDNTASNVIKPSTVDANGTSTLSNGVSGLPQTPDFPVKNFSTAVEASASGVSSALDPVIAPLLHQPSGAGPVKCEIGVKRLPSGNSGYKKKVPNKTDTADKDPCPMSMSIDDGLSTIKQQSPGKDNAPVNDCPALVTEITLKVASVSIESNSQLPASDAVPDSQHVIFPNHFQVSEALKNGLTFGSFDISCATRTESINGPVDDNKANSITGPSQGSYETVEESSPSNQTGDLGHMEVPLPSEEEPLKITNVAHEDPKPDTLLPPKVSQHTVVQDIPSNTFGFISPILPPSTMQSEVSETQERDNSRHPHFMNGTVPTVSSPIPIAQTSMAMPPQQIPIYRPPYPINYYPYGPYLTPIYMSPIHQLLGHNAAFQQPSAGNLYLPPAVAAAGGVKIPFSMYKPGNNNTTPIGIPSGYSPYGSTSMAYAASPAVTSGNSASNEDLAASQLKENNIYSAAQLSEAPAVWIPPVGQDLTSLQVNSLYNLPQGQQITFSPAPAGHGAFGMQQPPQTIAGSPSVHPLLQQSQTGTVETVGLPSGGAYQLPQHAHINWNTNF